MYTCIDNYVYMQGNYVFMYRWLCIHNHIIFFTQVKIYVVQWKTYVVMSLQGYRTFSMGYWKNYQNFVGVISDCVFLQWQYFKFEWYTTLNASPWIWFMQVSNCMMTSSNWNIFGVTGYLCGEFTGSRWIHRTKASDAELWCFHWSAPE